LGKRSGLSCLILLSVQVGLLALPALHAAAKTSGQSQSAQTKARTSTEKHLPKEKQPAGRPPDVVRQGNLIIVSKRLADDVRENNDIVLSTVAIKARVDRDGRFYGFQLFQVDRGSVVEKMGFKPKDILTGVNGIPARDLNGSRASLESADRFEITILRNGNEKKLSLEIR
jgi:type II secretory pathway component PulC